MASHGAFPAEEFGSGSRPTPLVDAPAWLKARSEPPGERVTLTPSDRAFLESPPTYGEGGSLLPPALPALPGPSRARRVVAWALFALIAGPVFAVLGLAVVHVLGRSSLGW